jgi:hypothetical protein
LSKTGENLSGVGSRKTGNGELLWQMMFGDPRGGVGGVLRGLVRGVGGFSYLSERGISGFAAFLAVIAQPGKILV